MSRAAARRVQILDASGRPYNLTASSYTGASSSRRQTREWAPGLGSANADTLFDLPALRARSRDLVRNAPIATGAVNTQAMSVIGVGLVPHAQVDREFLGLSDEQADEWERNAERHFEYWASSPACDVERRLDFAGIQEVSFRSRMESGDCFLLRRFIERPGELFGTRLQLIEADRVSNPMGRMDTDRLAGGIEVDANGAAIAVHVQTRHPGDYLMPGRYEWNRLPVYGAETGELQVLHLFHPTRPGQRRGVPYLAPIIELLKQLDRYAGAETDAAVLSSFFTAFIKTEGGDDVGGLVTEEPNDPNPAAENEMKMGPGAFVGLAPGEDVEFANPGRPNAQFDAFVRSVCSQIGVAIDLPFEMLIKHFTSSYSASRAALLEFWRGVMLRRRWVTAQLCKPVWSMVIGEAVMRGYLEAPGFFDNPLQRMAWLGVNWVGPAQGQIDPVADVDAAERRVAMGVSTLAEETAQLTGGDWERKHRQRVKEANARKRDGLDAEPVAERIVTEPKEPEPAEGAKPSRREVIEHRERDEADEAEQAASRAVA